DDRLPGEIGLRHFMRRVAEIEAGWRAAADLAHADLPGAALSQGQGLFHIAHHDDARCTSCEGDRGGRERPEPVDDGASADRAACALAEALDADFHRMENGRWTIGTIT